MPAPKNIDFDENPFGHELRRLREQAGLIQAQLSDKLGYSDDTISKVETGAAPPSEDFIRDCDTFFKTNGTLVTLAGLALRVAGLPSWFRWWAERIEPEAHTLRNWEPLVMPGLLQTEEYAHAVLRAGRPGATEAQIEEQVIARMERQKILGRDNSPRLLIVMDERVLHSPVGGPDVMYGQLQHLIEMSRRSNIQIHVVPLSSGAPAGLDGAFVIASVTGQQDVVYLESAHAGQVTDRPEVMQEIMNIYDAIRAEALPVSASLDLIEKVATQWT